MTIIGVIAALTIPNLLQKYQEEALKTAYKKTYNILNNAYKTVIAENGPLECYYNEKQRQITNDCPILLNELQRAFKVVKKCNNGLQDGCLPKNGYKNGKDVLIESGKTEEEATQIAGAGYCPVISSINAQRTFILSDGQIIIIHYSAPLIIFVDINGKKGPNKWGYDLFEFDLSMHKNKKEPVYIPGSTICVIKETGGKTPQEMYNSVILNK